MSEMYTVIPQLLRRHLELVTREQEWETRD